MQLKNKKVAVIGGAGFIGSYVVEELLKHDVEYVIVYDNFSRGKYENLENSLKDIRCDVFETSCDILNKDSLLAAIDGCDIVIHLAALWLLQCERFPTSAFNVNVLGTFNVLEACVAQKVSRLVFASSASVYGDSVIEPMDETHPYNNWTVYGATKIAGEHLIKSYFKKHNLNSICLRFMNVYGRRQDYNGAYVSVMMRVIDNIKRNMPPTIYGDGVQAYDFVHVTDVAKAVVASAASETPFGMYNVCTGIKTSVKEVVEKIMKIMGSSLPINYVPQINMIVSNRVGDPTLAMKDLGFKSSVSLDEGLRDLIKWRSLIG